ncbi:MAG: S4 domain-containing protein [Candidatus Thorarchaeota archaeon]|nr:S4 domain-containing protein [Candidatus Thorarchaeota archaeon]
MPRLDIWLVEEGHFSSRQAAKRAIKEGLVTVNGMSVKPSKQITGNEDVIVSSLALDLPQGYKKLKQIDDFLGGTLASGNTFALDIGSSAGGFLFYLDERGARSIGIEVSMTFVKKLHKIVDASENLSLIVGDAFTIALEEVCGLGELDLLLVDVTTEPEGTLQLIRRFTPLLRQEGRLVAAFKSKIDDDKIASIKQGILVDDYTDIQTPILDSSRREFHLIAIRR